MKDERADKRTDLLQEAGGSGHDPLSGSAEESAADDAHVVKHARSARRRFTAVLFFYLFSVALCLPSLAPLLVRYVGGDVAEASRLGGVYVAVQGALEFAAKPPAGQLSDRLRRRKPFLLVGLLGAAGGYLLQAAYPSRWAIAAGLALAGATNLFADIGFVYLADLAAAARPRTVGGPADPLSGDFAVVGICFGAAFVVGPAIGGALGSVSLRLPFFAAAAVAASAAAAVAFALPESAALRPADGARRPAGCAANPFRPLLLLAQSTPLLLLSLCSFANGLAQGAYNVLVLFAQERLGWDQLAAGGYLASLGLAAALALAALLPPLLPRFGERRLLLAALAFNVPRWALLGLAARSWHMYAVLLAGLPSYLDGTLLRALANGLVPPGERGALNAALGALGTLAKLAGAPLAGALFAAGLTARPAAPGLPFFAAAALAAAGLACGAAALRRWPAPPAADPAAGEEEGYGLLRADAEGGAARAPAGP